VKGLLATTSARKCEPADYSSFRSTPVPEGTLFVDGDNLEDSYDSRIREFGPVTADMIRDRPPYFYSGLRTSVFNCSIAVLL
jgi:Signal peptidase, peptidase S26